MKKLYVNPSAVPVMVVLSTGEVVTIERMSVVRVEGEVISSEYVQDAEEQSGRAPAPVLSVQVGHPRPT
jgi:hypothetical protein